MLGDAGYTLHENLLTPYRDNGHLTPQQENYNYRHSATRITVERAFALLKGRFRSLLTTFAMHRVDLIPSHILACCVLHNICLLQRDELHEEINETHIFEANNENATNDNNDTNANASNQGILKRDMICDMLSNIDL